MRFVARNNKRRRRVRGGPQRPDSPVVQPPPDTNPLWSDTATWGGSVPTTNDAVVIPADTIIVLDVDSAALGRLDIYGTLKFKDATNLTLSASAIWIHVGGRLEVGSPGNPFTAQAVIELTGAFSTLVRNSLTTFGASTGENDGVSRGINVEGALVLIGVPPTYTHTTLNASSLAGATSFTLASAPGWKSGDQIVVGPSDYYGYSSGASSPLTLNGDSSGPAISTTAGLAAARYGELQYATDSGMSLTPGTFTPPATPHPSVLDERAPVINTTRNIKVQGKNDTHWASDGHGVHIMAMGTSSLVQIDGVEIKRCGQRGALGRYPIHWHMISYNQATGAFIADVAGHYIKNSAIWDSKNRAITIHGTCGAVADNNVCYDISGHAVFFEDGSERRNLVTNNVVLKVRDPGSAFRIKKHDGSGLSEFASSSGFWVTNFNNTIDNNRAADCEGAGFWNSMASRCFGPSSLVSMNPLKIRPISYTGNIAHSNKSFGVFTDSAVTDDLGTTAPATQYNPTENEAIGGITVIPNLHRLSIWKNTLGGYRNRVFQPLYDEWVTADNGSMDLQGTTSFGNATRLLCVGTSLNSSTYPSGALPRAAFATYNGSITFHHNTLVQYPWVDGLLWASNQVEAGGGVFRHDDHYLKPVEKETLGAGAVGNYLVNSNGGFRTRPAHIDGNPLGFRYWTLAGALYDANGLSTPSPGQYWIYDDPFFTSGISVVDVEPAGQNEVATDTVFFGVDAFYTDFDTTPFLFRAAITATKVDNSLATLGEWVIPDGNASAFLGHMRHFAVHQGGRYIVTFPGYPNPTTVVRCSVSNAPTASDSFVIALPFNGAVTARAAILTHRDSAQTNTYPSAGPKVRQLSSTTSRALVEAGSGNLFWQDTANNRVWIKYVGGGLVDPGWVTNKELLYKWHEIIVTN